MKHPATQDALRYINSREYGTLIAWLDAFNQDKDDDVSLRCGGTLVQVINGAGIDDMNDIDILGLAYVMKQGECG